MGNVSSELTAQIFERCQTGTDKIATALERAFGSEFHVLYDDELTVPLTANDSPLWGQGLVMLIGFGGVHMMLAIPEQSGLLPDWYSNPGSSQKAKLETFVSELAAALLPEDIATESTAFQGVPDLQGVLAASGVDDSASKAYLILSADDKQATLGLVFPLPRADAVFRLSSSEPRQGEEGWALPPYESTEEGLTLLPPYVRSLLKIKLPVRVTLAEQKQPLHRIADINYGSLIQFEKSCDEMLTLEVADRKIAEGEAVKVGDRFGLRITSIALPEERFSKLKRE